MVCVDGAAPRRFGRSQRMEIVEIKEHPYFVAAQFHPEFKSRPNRPSPLFLGFILAATKQLDGWFVKK